MCRVGWSVLDSPVESLGEMSGSFGYGASGKKTTDNSFISYGEAFTVGDVIESVLDLEERTISFAINGFPASFLLFLV
jgi:hypothetical protein